MLAEVCDCAVAEHVLVTHGLSWQQELSVQIATADDSLVALIWSAIPHNPA